jgi:hypothetical protein
MVFNYVTIIIINESDDGDIMKTYISSGFLLFQ